MRRPSTPAAIALSLLTLATVTPAIAGSGNGLGAAWASWKASAPVALSARSAGYASGTIPQTIDPGANGDYADLRVVDGTPQEVPYAIDPASPAGPASQSLPLSEAGFVRGAYSQVVADAGNSGTLHEALSIETSRSTFFVRGSVEASDDRRVWRDLASETTLYRVAEHGDAGNQTIAFAPTRSRWLRVRVYDPHAAFPIDGVSITLASRAPSALVPLTASIASDATPPASDQRFVLDFGTPNTLVAAIRIDGTAGFFSRNVTVASSDDGQSWSEAGSGAIERFAEGGADLGFAFDEVHGRYLRVTIDNGNDRPLPGLHPVALQRPRHLVFAAQPGRSYAIAFGNPAVAAPEYDLATRLARENWHPTLLAHVGSVIVDTMPPPDTRSFFERYPWVVTVAFVIVGLGLGLFALQTLRGATKDQDPGTGSSTGT